MIRRGPSAARPALSLLEVLIALTIFLLSFAALSQLASFAAQRALDAQHRGEESRLAQSKMEEVLAGAVTLSSQGDTPFDEDSDYSWSMTADAGSVTNLYTVSITVKRKGDEGQGFTLRQMVFDPTQRGSTQDTITISGSDSTATGTPAGSTSTQSQSQSATATPAAAKPAAASPVKSSTPAVSGSPTRTSTSTPKSGSTGTSKGGA